MINISYCSKDFNMDFVILWQVYFWLVVLGQMKGALGVIDGDIIVFFFYRKITSKISMMDVLCFPLEGIWSNGVEL